MIKRFIQGFLGLFKGIKLIQKPELRRFVVIPFMINLVLFTAALILLIMQMQTWLHQLIPDLSGWWHWLEVLIMWIIWPTFILLILFVVYYSFTFVANIIAAPFNGLLAEKTERLLQGEDISHDSLIPLWSSISKTFASEISKLVYLAIWSLVLGGVSLVLLAIPIINFVIPWVWLIFGAWMMALEYLDYPMGNHSLFFREVKQQARSHRSGSLGFGTAVTLLTSIPIINFITMPAAVAGATALWLEQQNHD